MIGNLTTMLLAAVAAPVPADNPGAWATTADYPLESLQNKQEGTVKFRLVVETDGSPRECTIVESSGHIALDNRTCEVLMARARFVPADANGYSVKNSFQSQIRWNLPEYVFDPTQVTSNAPGFCGFDMSSADPAATKFIIMQDEPMASSDRIRVILLDKDWPIRSDDKIVETIKIQATHYSFWNTATAIDNGFMLMMDGKHVRKFIDSYPIKAVVYRGDRRMGDLKLTGLQKEYGKFTACVAKRKSAPS